jgi:CMP-N-acetylneuraminic acid synthetase
MRVCIIINARLGSTRVPKKMGRPFGNSTLLDILAKKLEKSTVINPKDVYFSLYEDELKDIINKYNFNIYHRSKESAFAETGMTTVFEWWNKLDYDKYFLLSACHPFLTIETIDEFYKNIIKNDRKGLFGVVKRKNYFWDSNKNMITKWTEGQTGFNTKYVDETYEAAHCLYSGYLKDIGKNIQLGDFSKNEVNLYVIEDEFQTLDIDYPWQFDLYDKFIKYNLTNKK